MQSTESNFGSLLRSTRRRAGLGLRTFAMLVDQRASTVSAIESGRRGPWQQKALLRRVAGVLGIADKSAAWEKLCTAAKSNVDTSTSADQPSTIQGELLWWMENNSANLSVDYTELVQFLGVSVSDSDTTSPGDRLRPLTDLEIEWHARRQMGRRSAQLAAAPVDVEAVLETATCENDLGVRLEILPGLIPRYSVEACAIGSENGLTLVVDRIVADSRPVASYRYLLAKCFAPLGSGLFTADEKNIAAQFAGLRSSNEWRRFAGCCEQYALAMMLPARPMIAAADAAFAELMEQGSPHDSPQTDAVLRYLRNRLAEWFAVPPASVQKRLEGWPCYVAERVAVAIEAQERVLPAADWMTPPSTQQILFAK